MLLCFQILSGCTNSRKSQERKYKANVLSPSYFSLVTYYANISPLTKVQCIFKNSFRPSCLWCRWYIFVYFTCLSPLSQLCFLYSQLPEGNCCPSPFLGHRGGKWVFLASAEWDLTAGESCHCSCSDEQGGTYQTISGGKVGHMELRGAATKQRKSQQNQLYKKTA